MTPKPSTLKQRYHLSKPNNPDELNLRLHRAISWLDKADDSQDDLDIRYISLWIAFNAVYARELIGINTPDRTTFTEFLNNICRLDKQGAIYQLVWQKFQDSIRVMLDNPYVFVGFWDHHNGIISQNAWQEDFAKANKKAFTALAEQDTHAILTVIFDRLYTLRNQIVHGGATYQSSVNRHQVKDGCDILASLIPTIIEIMLANPQQDWGKPYYPVVAG